MDKLRWCGQRGPNLQVCLCRGYGCEYSGGLHDHIHPMSAPLDGRRISGVRAERQNGRMAVNVKHQTEVTELEHAPPIRKGTQGEIKRNRRPPGRLSSVGAASEFLGIAFVRSTNITLPPLVNIVSSLGEYFTHFSAYTAMVFPFTTTFLSPSSRHSPWKVP